MKEEDKANIHMLAWVIIIIWYIVYGYYEKGYWDIYTQVRNMIVIMVK